MWTNNNKLEEKGPVCLFLGASFRCTFLFFVKGHCDWYILNGFHWQKKYWSLPPSQKRTPKISKLWQGPSKVLCWLIEAVSTQPKGDKNPQGKSPSLPNTSWSVGRFWGVRISPHKMFGSLGHTFLVFQRAHLPPCSYLVQLNPTPWFFFVFFSRVRVITSGSMGSCFTEKFPNCNPGSSAEFSGPPRERGIASSWPVGHYTVVTVFFNIFFGMKSSALESWKIIE